MIQIVCTLISAIVFFIGGNAYSETILPWNPIAVAYTQSTISTPAPPQPAQPQVVTPATILPWDPIATAITHRILDVSGGTQPQQRSTNAPDPFGLCLHHANGNPEAIASCIQAN